MGIQSAAAGTECPFCGKVGCTTDHDVGDGKRATRACPFCGEQILTVAIKCKHCQSVLNAGAMPTSPAPARGTAAPPTGDTSGVILLLAPWIGVALIWLWVGESPLIQASNNLTLACAIVIIGTAIVAAVDASNLGLGVKGTAAEKGNGPGATFFYVLLLWVIMYPVHMSERAKYAARKPHGWAAVIGALAFTGSAIYLGMLINEKVEEIRRAFAQ